MSQHSNHSYEFGPFRLDAGEGLLLPNGEVVPLTHKALDLLLALRGITGMVSGCGITNDEAVNGRNKIAALALNIF